MMKVTKFGHCCLVIEVAGVKILTDPGNHEFAGMGADPVRLPTVDAIVITHEHPDHFHLPALKVVRENNPGALICATSGVSGQLSKIGVNAEILEHRKTFTVGPVAVMGIGKLHAEIYGGWNRVPNTGIMVANRFFFPGDAFSLPGVPVEILALPIAGPWMKIREAVDYVLTVKPRHVIPVHDGMLKTAVPQHRLLESVLPPAGIQFLPAELATPMEFPSHP